MNRADATVDGAEGSWELTSVAVWEPAREPVFGTGKREFRRVQGWGVTICKLRGDHMPTNRGKVNQKKTSTLGKKNIWGKIWNC